MYVTPMHRCPKRLKCSVIELSCKLSDGGFIGCLSAGNAAQSWRKTRSFAIHAGIPWVPKRELDLGEGMLERGRLASVRPGLAGDCGELYPLESSLLALEFCGFSTFSGLASSYS